MTPHQVMRSILGTDEYAGGGDNPVILAWRDAIAQRFPEMAAYCANYTHDSIPWCGLTVAYCMASCGIRPIFGGRDVERFLWAAAWKDFGFAIDADDLAPGDVVVFQNHVALFDRWVDSSRQVMVVVGGNQSDSVTEARYKRSSLHAARRAPEARAPAAPSPHRMENITATWFGGPSDNMAGSVTAYQTPGAWWEKNAIALPYRFRGARPRVWVENVANGKRVLCDIVDVGPHNINDPYWQTGTRPKAERGIREPGLGGAPKNKAGIDLTYAAAQAIGLSGKGAVNWWFEGAPAPSKPAPGTEPATPAIAIDTRTLLLLALLALALWPQLEKLLMSDDVNRESGMPSPPATPATTTTTAATSSSPSLLQQILPIVAPQIVQLLVPKAPSTPASAPAPANNTTGVGVGITGVLGVVVAAIFGWIGVPLPANLVGDSASSIAQLLLAIFGGTAALGQSGTISWLIDLGRRILAPKQGG